jgi:hypothetical protein
MSEQNCRWVATDRPRALVGEHYDNCPGDDCKGCWPCTEQHCLSCGRTHTEGICAGCLNTTRNDLTEIAHLCGFPLLEEVLTKGAASEAAMLLAPAANTEAWQHRAKSAIFGRVDDAYLEDCRDEAHPLWTLGWIETEWRDAFGHEQPERTTVADAAAYIGRMLHTVAGLTEMPDGSQPPEFDDAKRRLAACRSHLEDVLSEGIRDEKGAPCPKCDRPLIKRYGRNEHFDRWVCPSKACGTWYLDEEYRRWVTDDYRANSAHLTAADMHAQHDVPQGSTRGWAAAGKVRKRGKDANGRQLYDVADVLAQRDGKQTA